jgi:hypothetical protein
MKKKVAIIISTYNQNELLIRCIESIKKKTDYGAYKLFFIDDASKDKIGGIIRKKFPKITVLINEKNQGFSKSYNRGIKKAIEEYNPDYVLLLNDDSEVMQKDWLKNMIDVAEKDEKASILGCKIVYPDKSLQWFAKKNKTFFFAKPGYLDNDPEIGKIQEVDDIMGVVFLMKRKVIEKVGILDEGFSPFYGEETDLCFRTLKAGFKNIYIGAVTMIHHRSQTINELSENFVWYIRKKNSIRLEWLNFSLARILKLSFIHFGSIFFKKEQKIRFQKSILKKFVLFFKAYFINLKNLGEILKKRKDRNKKRNRR